jgi:hypothetical protein
VLELETVIEELREQLAAITDEYDAALMREEDLFQSLAETEEELNRAQQNYMNLAQRLQQRSLELFNTLEIIDPDWAFSDLDASELVLYEAFFIEIAGSQKLVGVENPRLRNFILGHTGVKDINTELLKVAALNNGYQLDMKGFLRILREVPVCEGEVYQTFIELPKDADATIKVQDCRSGLLEFLSRSKYVVDSNGSAVHKGTFSLESILDKLMADACLTVSLEQWFNYCQKGARLSRLLYFARGAT